MPRPRMNVFDPSGKKAPPISRGVVGFTRALRKGLGGFLEEEGGQENVFSGGTGKSSGVQEALFSQSGKGKRKNLRIFSSLWKG